MRLLRIAPVVAAGATSAACRTGRSYLDPLGPRYSDADSIPVRASAHAPDSVRIVTFNIAFARKIEEAVVLLRTDPHLRDADILFLQEMNAGAAARVARALQLHFVYYPAIYHTRAKQDIGNVVLSRWPIVDDAKLILPHPSRYAGTRRAATAASIRVDTTVLRVYAIHLGTPADIASGARRDQLRAIIADAARYDKVIIAGDMNQGDLGPTATQAGFAWPTEHGPRTTRLGRWDHVFVRGVAVDSGSTGTAANDPSISDHRAVWAVVRLRAK
jgi:endonuclease/exonuclease/phosphatase family metal-dependent hydrolase